MISSIIEGSVALANFNCAKYDFRFGARINGRSFADAEFCH
jgi:hypothetical protein